MPAIKHLAATAAAASLIVGGLLTPVPASAAAAPASRPAPAASHLSKFGASVNRTDDVTRLSALLGRPLTTVRRFYLHTPPTTWAADQVLATVPANGTVAVSFKRGTPAQVQTFLSGHPATTKCYASYWHEPEDNFTTAAAQATYRATWKTFAPAIRAAGCTPTLILMKWTLDPRAHLNWHNWYPAGAVDAIAFDAYNTSAKSGGYGDPTRYLEPVQAVSRQTRLPYALTEVGSYIPAGTTSANRAAWARGVAAAATADPNFLFATWWDASTNSGLDYHLDNNSARVWHS